MNANDVKVWKDLLSELTELSEQNRVILEEIKEEIELQKQRNKQEVQQLSAEVSSQASALEELLRQLDTENLFSLPSDQSTLNSFKATLQAQLDKTRQMVNYSHSLLESQTTSQTTMDKIKIGTRRGRERTQSYLPKLFRKEYVLGNWVHHVNDNSFVAQAFWDDDTFKEYQFRNNRILSEKEGTYTVGNGQVQLVYEDGSRIDFTVGGFTDQSIDYLSQGQTISFDYMPERLLNDLLDGQPAAPKE